MLISACGARHPAQVSVPPAPDIQRTTAGNASAPDTFSTHPPAKKQAEATSPDREDGTDALGITDNTPPLLLETGLASWYGPPYHNRRGANGQIYDMNALTAAHRTLPLGSIVRVTNVKTGSSAIVRITDRGPFIEGRILDLSSAAAKKIDLWRAGVAMVRLEVLKAPVSLDAGGRWAVQIGAFDEEHDANKLADHLSKHYQTAKVLCFSSPTGDWWVRVRVQDDEKKRAEEVARKTETSQGTVFLVRLD